MLDLTMGSLVRWLGATALGSVAVLGACVIEGGPGPTATELYALIDLHCDRATTCGCAFALGEEGACTGELEARWKARLSEAQRRDLRYDAACFATLTAQIEQQRCYWPGGDVPLCESYCSPFHGDRAEGEDCQGDDALVSDCAQGLVCAEGTCTSPCAAINGRLAGERCANEMVGGYDDCSPGLYCGYSGQCEVAPTEGAPCPSGECGPDLYCDWQTNTCVTASGVGETCFEVPCMDGLYCDWQTDACRVPPGEGEPCFDSPCQPGLYCEWTGKGETGTCRAYAAEGEDCSQLPCDDELWCNEANRCVTAPVEGQPCLFGYLCAEEIVCNLEGLCVAPPTEGQPCASGTCDDDSWCDSSTDPAGICAARKANDEMCSGHDQCQSSYCPNGFCWALPLDGDACDGSGVCGGGLVCNGTTCEPTVTRGPAACTYLGW
jgi:hypothetical protein